MKYGRYCMVLIGIGLLLLSNISVMAVTVTDPTGDVVHATWSVNNWGYASITDKPNIDITSVSADINNGKLTLSLTVVGPIVQSENTAYIVRFNTSDATYMMMYGGYGGDLNGTSWGTPNNGNYLNMSFGKVTLVGTNTITSTLNVSGTATTKVALYGTAYQYTGNPSQNLYGEFWADVAGDHPGFQVTPGGNNTGGNNTGGNTTGKKTPGFEVIPVIAAVAIAAILLRRRR